MKILFLTYDIGNTASGIISQRMLEGLTSQGHELVAVVSESSKIYENLSVFCIKPLLSSDSLISRIINKIRKILGADVFNNNYIWRFRACIKISCLLRHWKPDVIYCRTSPIDPCFVGIWVKNKYNIPLVTNLTDPLPAPIEYLPNSSIRHKRMIAAKKIISYSDLLSMGNTDALNYQIKEVGIDFAYKSFISPDPIPEAEGREYSTKNHNYIELLYLGAIYGSRNIYPLLDAITLMRKDGFPIVFRTCGIVPSGIKHEFLIKEKFVKNIDEKVAYADILVDIDGDDKEPIFISSKLKQYLVLNRPILSITPPMSPSARLLEGIRSIKVVNNNVNEIYKAIKYLMKERESFDYTDRRKLIDKLSITNVVSNLIFHIETKLLCDRFHGRN